LFLWANQRSVLDVARRRDYEVFIPSLQAGLHQSLKAAIKPLAVTPKGAGRREGVTVVRLVGIVVLAMCGVFAAFANDFQSATRAASPPPAMRFQWHTEKPAQDCTGDCRVWISATGPITVTTPGDFQLFARNRDLRRAMFVLDSEGGSVLGAIALGRMIRALEMTTTVGRSKVYGTTAAARSSLSPNAECQSMCVFVLLGGARRYVPPQAKVLVHQIWLDKKRTQALEVSYTAEELSVVQRDIGSLAAYTVEMGGRIALLEMALKVPPWEPLRLVSADDLRGFGLINADRLYDEPVAPPVLTSSRPNPVTTASATPGR
jgi:hypothetical protein